MNPNQLAWDYVCNKPGVVLIRGMLGMGKTSSGFKILESIQKIDPSRPQYVYMFDRSKEDELKALLPDYIQYTDKIDGKAMENGSVFLLDEAWLNLSSKVKHSNDAIVGLMDLLALSRQRNQTIILIIQNLALLEKSGTRFGYSMISKFTPMLTITQERPELVNYLMGVQVGIENRLAAYPELIPQQVSHVNTPFSSLWDNKFKYFPDYTFQYYILSLPSFWSDELSVFWSRYT